MALGLWLLVLHLVLANVAVATETKYQLLTNEDIEQLTPRRDDCALGWAKNISATGSSSMPSFKLNDTDPSSQTRTIPMGNWTWNMAMQLAQNPESIYFDYQVVESLWIDTSPKIDFAEIANNTLGCVLIMHEWTRHQIELAQTDDGSCSSFISKSCLDALEEVPFGPKSAPHTCDELRNLYDPLPTACQNDVFKLKHEFGVAGKT
jgi:hypothetical protein